MRVSPVQIGPIKLQGFEVPPSICFGGRHRLAIHNLSGGRRIVERLGPEDGELQFHGTFSGLNAEARAREFDNLRLSGEIVWLNWQSFKRRVVVKSFVAEYQGPWWIPYRVSCVVVHQTLVTLKPTMTVAALIAADLVCAMSAVVGTAVSLTTLRAALSRPNALTKATVGQSQAVAAVRTTLGSIDVQIAAQSAVISAIENSGARSSADPFSLTKIVSTAGLLASAVIIRSYIGRIGTNLISLEG